jgi:hypothetical protein
MSQIQDNYCKKNITLSCSDVENNQFTIYGENCRFFWIVYGKRLSIETEPLKVNTQIKGEGPYKWVNN